ncbi:hypothetical protein ACT17_06340 [Mycolicibacterium conceptionense]|uniref:Uncharacterized protein n=1 Tax=Mycolicibacterium conceptionense TaxID=451644 RepID=A0A0J8UEB2_9MYCO|nr:hypothetical protein [Mycolicibacterium conceptionense]KMV19651.1 hypothetical protein ACT17_06340 [Mycolicibacterium conceptionense]
MAEYYPDEEQRKALCDTPVTLDGEPAKISGWALPFAKVHRRDGRGGEVEFAWSTAARIVELGGRFSS